MYLDLVGKIPSVAQTRDFLEDPSREKRGKLASARWTVTCTETGRRHLAELAPMPDKVMLSYHGLDLDHVGRRQLESKQ